MVQLPFSSNQLATLSIAVSALLFTAPLNAASIGKTKINSSQHETISASINVSDIDANNFSVAVAPNIIYKQMNMNTNVKVKARFVKTSESTGKIILSSSQPVSAPFADVVLNLTDNGRQQTVPKTLLLPLTNNKNSSTSKDAKTVVGSTPKPNLPVVSANSLNNKEVVPLQVKRKAPPPLSSTNKSPTQNSQEPLNRVSIAAKPHIATSTSDLLTANTGVASTVDTQTQKRMFEKLPSDQQMQSSMGSSNSSTAVYSDPANNDMFIPATGNHTPASSAGSNTQLDILSTKITRKYSTQQGEIQSSKNIVDESVIIKPEDLTINTSASSTSSDSTNDTLNNVASENNADNENQVVESLTNNTPTIDAKNDTSKASDAGTKSNASTQTSSDKKNTTATQAEKNSKPDSSLQTKSSTPNTKIPLGDARYTVQKNDNLWTISQQIATKNNMNVNQVMNQIQTYNPEAFINGDKSKLLADVELSLPDYEVIPSKLGIKAAREARREARQAAKMDSQSSKDTSQEKTPTNAIAKSPNRAVPPAKTNNRPSLKLVTPDKQGQATGTGTKSTGSSFANGIDQELITQLKTSRKRTAFQSQRINNLNEKLALRTQTLQLNNQKLANLQRRLKELKAKQ